MKKLFYMFLLATCCFAIDTQAQSGGVSPANSAITTTPQEKLTKSFTFSGSVHTIVNGVYELNGVNKLGQPRYTHSSGDYEVNYDGKGTWWLNTDKNLSGGPKYYRAAGNEQGPPSTGWVDNEGNSTQVAFVAGPQNAAFDAALIAQKNTRKAAVTYVSREGTDDINPNQVIKVVHVPAKQILNRGLPTAVKKLNGARAAATTYYVYNLRVGHYKINDDGGGCDFSGENPDPRYKVSTSGGLSFSQTVNVGDDKPCGWQRMNTDGRYMQAGNYNTTTAASPFQFTMNIDAWEEDACGGDNDYNDDCFTNDDDHPASTSTTVTIDPSNMNLGYNFVDIEWSGNGARYGLSLEWELLDAPKIVTLYSDANLTGRTQHFGSGDYNTNALFTGVGNDNVSSMEIASGYKVITYNNTDHVGYPIEFRGTVNFVEGANDRTSSFRVVPDDNLPGNDKTLFIYYNGSGKSLKFQLQRFATKVNADQMVFIKGVGGDTEDYTAYNQDNLQYREGEEVNRYDGFDAFNPFPTTFYSNAKVFKNDNFGGGTHRYFFGVDMDYDGSVGAGYEDEDSYIAASNVMRVLRRYNLKGYSRIVISGHSRGSAVGISSFLHGIKKALENDAQFSEFNGVINTVFGSAATINVLALDPVAGADTPGLRNDFHMGDGWRAREIYQWLKGRFSNINFSEIYANGGRMLESDELLGLGGFFPGNTFDPSPNYLHVEPSNNVQRYWLGYRHSSMVNKEEKWSELYDAAGIPRPWLHTADMLNAGFYNQTLFRNHQHWYDIFHKSDQLAWLKALEFYGCTDSPSAQAFLDPLTIPDADLEFQHYHGTRHTSFNNSDDSPVNMDDFVGNNNIKFHCSDESQVPQAAGTSTASNSYTDGEGWTHYCSCEGKRLLSLKLGGTGADIPTNGVSFKESNNNYFVANGSGFITNPNGAVVMGRSWNVTPTTQPSSNVGVRFYFRQSDYDNINTHFTILRNEPPLSSINRLFFFNATSGNAHANVQDIPTAIILQNGPTASASNWTLGNTLRGDYYAEYQAASLTGGSGGGLKCATPAAISVTETSGTANDGTICAGSGATLTGTGGDAYVWSTGETTATINVTTAGTYTVTVSNAAGCTAQAMTTITVNPLSVGGSMAGSATVCSGTNSTALTLSEQVGTIQKWQSSLSSNFASSTDITNTTTNLTATNLTQTTYYRAVVQSGACSAAFSATATVTVNPLSVGGSVAGSATVCSGTNSTPLTLSDQVGNIQKWQSSLTSNFATSTDITNTTTNLTATNLTQTTYYRAVVKSGICDATFSATSTVTVNPLNVGGSMAGSATVCSGTNSTPLTLSEQVGTIQKWQSSLSSNFTSPTDITNTTTNLTATNLTQTTYYRAVVKSGVCDAALSATATVTVNPLNVGGSIAGSATVCTGTNSTALTLSEQVGTIQKWQSSLSSGFSNPTDITNTTTNLTATNLTQTTYYRAVVQSGICDATFSATATVTVNPLSVGGSVAGSATVCSGTNSTPLTLSEQVGTIQKWQSSLSSNFTSPTDITNTTTNLTATNLTQTTYYRAVVKSGVCDAALSATATVTVNPLNVGGSIAGSATVCSGTNSTALTLSEQVGSIQKWQSSLSSGFNNPTDITNTTTNLTATNLTQTTYYRAVVQSGICEAAFSATATVTVNPLSVGGSVAGSATVCSGTNSTLLTLSEQVGTIQKWQSSLSSNFTSPTDITNTTVNLTATNLTQTTYYRAVVQSGICEAAFSATATVTIKPIHSMALSSATKSPTGCLNAAIAPISFALSGGATGATVSGLPAGVTSSVANGVLTISGTPSVSGVFHYNITTTGNECASASESGTITLNTKPSISLTINGQTFNEENTQLLCDTDANPDNTLLLKVTTSCVAATPLWRVQVGAGAWSDWSATVPSTQPSDNQVYKYQAACDPDCPSNYTQPITLRLIAQPSDFALSGGGISFCAAPLSISTAGSQINVNYQLKRNNVNLGNPIEGTGNPISFSGLTQAGTYSVLATTTVGNCSRTLSDQITIQTRNAPTAYNLSGGGTSCSGAPLSINLSNSQIGVNYQLKRENTLVGNPIPGTGSALNFPPQNTAGTYSVVALSQCPDLTMNNTVSVTALTTPANNFTVTGGGTSCGTPLPVGLSGSQTGVFYQLLRDNTPMGTPVQGTGNAISLGSHAVVGIYTVVATRAGQCPTNMAESVLIKLITAPATFNVTGGGTACSNGVTIGLSGTQSGVTYQLKRGTTVVSTLEGDGNPLAFPNQSIAGTYTVEANVNGNCLKSMNGNAAVSAGGTLPNSYTMTGGGTFCNNTPLPLGLSDSQKNVYYQLQRNTPSGFVNVGTTVQGTGNSISLGSHSILGEYRVVVNSACVTEMTGRKSISACNAREANELLAGGTLAGASLSPNPVANILHLKVNDVKGQQVNVSLLDASGRMLLQRTFVPESNQHQEEFEVSHLSNGMYFLKVNTTDKQTTLKVVKVQ